MERVSPIDLTPQPAAEIALESGVRDLALATAGAEAAGFEPGALVRLKTASGRALGLAIADPENALLRVMVAPGEPFEALDADLAAARLERAQALRRRLGLVAPGSAWRLFHGAGDGLPGLAADALGEQLVVHAYSAALMPFARELAAAALARGFAGVVIKHRGRGAAGRGELAQEALGAPAPEPLVVHERSVPFEVHPRGGLNVGLFTDMREHRHGLARVAPGARVLNGFAYTGTLSTVCARAGAAAVTSVDLSAGVLRWARDNFALSGLDPSDPRWRFEAADCARFLERARERGERYDLVLLDPPTFSAARGAAFAIERDYPALIARACAVLERGSLLWLAANTRNVSLETLALRGTALARRDVAVLEQGGLPPDHPTLPAQPADRYLQTVLLRVG
ncbi:MAG: class I SAM-dependent methyltransferase [Vicinamibacteria bacterium]|nr:class I SAM-dependent methyltransferase [Vicinamibacteria bacterium]